MELKTLISGHFLSRKAFILAITTVTMVFCVGATLSGCTKEEAPVEVTRQLVIPSELEPEAVLPDFGGKDYGECTYDTNDETKICRPLESWRKDERMGKDLEKGYRREYSWYILPDGSEIGPGHPLLIIIVLKYETISAAVQAFTDFAEYQGWEDVIFNGVKMKRYVPREMPEKMTYMMQSNNFIIYIESSDELAKDAATSIIELYSVPISNEH
ncbi:MAG: hypothetical protein JXB43_07475 [Dehalococcoidia bacterium]|nr:hypothetical protein [Dehalococcoidia bacterium]